MERDRLPWLLLALVAGIALVLLAAASVEAPVPAHGIPHPEHPSLQRGGDGLARAAGVLLPGWLFGALQLGFFSACFALGVRRGSDLGPLRVPILLCTLAHQAGWAAVVAGWWRFASGPDPLLVLSFPLPTALMLYVLWPLPLLFLALYLRAFDGWILTQSDLARFRAALEEQRRRDEGP